MKKILCVFVLAIIWPITLSTVHAKSFDFMEAEKFTVMEIQPNSWKGAVDGAYEGAKKGKEIGGAIGGGVGAVAGGIVGGIKN